MAKSENPPAKKTRKHIKTKTVRKKNSVSVVISNVGTITPGSIPLRNKRRELFCIEYVKDRNGTQASIRAGYAKANAKQNGSFLLTVPDVQDRIAFLGKQIAQVATGSAFMNLSYVARIRDVNVFSFFDIETRFLLSDGSMARDGDKIPDNVRIVQAIQWLSLNEEFAREHGDIVNKVTRNKAGEIVVGVPDKLGAARLIGEYHGLWDDGSQKGRGDDTTKDKDLPPLDPNDPLYDKWLEELE